MTSRDDHFAWDASVALSQCTYCRHLLPGPAAVCSAFPGSIPANILANETDHRRPWTDPETGQPGDRGVADGASILFEPRPAIRPAALASLYRVLDAVPV